MQQLWDFLRSNPILFFVIVAWVAGAIGNAVRAKSAQQKRRGLSRPAQTPTRDPDAVVQAQPQPRRAVRPEPIRRTRTEPAQPVAGGARGPDEIAAEMRRILGLDVDVQPAAPERSEPVRRAPRVEVVEPEAPSRPVSPTTGKRHLELHAAPHVGANISQRPSGTASSNVGKHDRDWGSLGGRRREAIAAVAATPLQRLVDLGDLKRIIIGAEILGKPIALRDPSQDRMF